MKKVISLMMVLLLAAGMLLGCSGGEGASGDGGSGDSVTLNAIFMKQAGYSEDDIKAITENFKKENENIDVKLTFVPYEALEQKILTSAAAGQYDVVLIDAPWTAKFATAGLVKDITDKLSGDAKSDIFDGVLNAVTYEDKLYGMPWLNDTKYLFYNKKMIQEAGFNEPPKTWGELAEQAQAIKDKGIVEYPVVWSWAQAEALVCDVTSVFNSYGGKMIDDSGNPTFTDQANVEALTFMKDSIDKGLTNPNSTESLEEDVRGTFSSGKAAFALNWTYMYNMANDENESDVAGDVGIAPSPGTPSIDSASVNGGMGLAITQGSKHEEEAWKYIEFLSSKDVQKDYAQNALPIWKSLYDDQEVVDSSPEVVEAAKTQYDYIVNRPKVPWYGELSQKVQVEVQNVLLGKNSPEDGLKKIQAEAEKLAKE